MTDPSDDPTVPRHTPSPRAAAADDDTVRKSGVRRLVLTLSAFLLHAIVWQLFNTSPVGDELRYLDQAERLLAGLSPYPGQEVRNPPLYPLIMMVLLKIGVPTSALNLLSILATSATVFVLFPLLERYCTPLWATILTCLAMLYPPMLMLGSQLMTEPFVALLLVLACRVLLDIPDPRRPGLGSLLLLAPLLAALALFKPLFGYTAAATCGLAVLLYVANAWRLRGFYRWAGAATLLSLVLCAPYVAYIHSLTGDRFGWGTTGGEHAYWMSIGGKDVWGSWVSSDKVSEIDFLVREGYADEVAFAQTLDGPASQRYYARLGAQRIRQEPLHFVRNLFANAGRVLFNYPFSFRAQSLYTYGYLLPNMALYLSLLLSFALLLPLRRRQHAGLVGMIAFLLVYLAGNIAAGSTGRQAVALIGPLLLWLAFQGRTLIDAGVVSPAAIGRAAAGSGDPADR